MFAFHIMTKISPSCLKGHLLLGQKTLICQIASKKNTILPVIELVHILAVKPQISGLGFFGKKLVQFRTHLFYYDCRDKINFRSFVLLK